MKTLAIIVSAGKGKRFGDILPKQFHLINGVPVIAKTLLCFENSDIIDKICLVIDNKLIEKYEKILKKYRIKKVLKIVSGGKERQDSVYNGLFKSGNNWDIVVVHDGVRPFVTESLLESVVVAAKKYGAAIPGIKPVDTLKISSHNSYVKETIDRDKISVIQTPQAFRSDILRRAHIVAKEKNYRGTDDAELVEKIGLKVKIIEGDYKNIKITTKYDIIIGSVIDKFLI